MIQAKEIDGELWIRASDHHQAIKQALEQPEPEPRVWIDHRVHAWPDCFVMQPDPPHTSPLYTSPPKREWQGLTDEEIDTWNIVGHESLREFVRAIEAKLKEKNHDQ